MPRRFLLNFAAFCFFFAAATTSPAEGLVRSKTRFYYKNTNGKVTSARIVRRYYVPVVYPSASVDPRLDVRLRHAATIAEERANAHTKARCWHYVKEALLAAGAVKSLPKSIYACEAGNELARDFGFKRLPIRDPYAAPIGAVIVYGRGKTGAGHVEFRTRNGFVSDYRSKTRCYYPLLAVYGKFSS